MNRKSICALICLSVAGCLEPETYEFDFGQEPGFEWDGKVRVTKRPEWHLGPFLIIDQYWTVDRIEFGSRDGRIAIVDTRGSGAGATVDPNL
ncbi:MAG: hypothetical protein JXQ73_33670, partial [Phycisphaerae bacterium]|nr:hypothetical protein [Phycisphaerae bacterium]